MAPGGTWPCPKSPPGTAIGTLCSLSAGRRIARAGNEVQGDCLPPGDRRANRPSLAGVWHLPRSEKAAEAACIRAVRPLCPFARACRGKKRPGPLERNQGARLQGNSTQYLSLSGNAQTSRGQDSRSAASPEIDSQCCHLALCTRSQESGEDGTGGSGHFLSGLSSTPIGL